MFDTMSLDEMRHYYGREEVPQNFDEFWDNELLQVSSLPEYTLEACQFNIPNVQAYELKFKGTNHGVVYAKCVFPKEKKTVPVVFHFHGYQGQSPDWSQCLNYVAAGFGVVAMDVRGQAGKSIDHGVFDGVTVKGQVIRGMTQSPDKLFYKDIYLDIYQMIEILAQQEWVDENCLMSFGGSQGGALALIAGALNQRIKKVVSIYPFLSDFKRILELGDSAEAYNELFRYFKYKDPFHETEQRILDNLAYIDIKNFAHRIQCPVKFFVGMQDDVCPPSTQFAAYNRIESEKSVHIMPEYGHEAMNVFVNDLVFNWLVGSEIATEV